ncbi:centromere protein K isoform X2 [Amia ocellicauda]|uniref:centromere protein K isoform X2 n=1 Tax=Amia ocellicauda TaxID=2972642 RepID=UPI0034644ADD
MDADELLQHARALAKQMSVYQGSLAPDLATDESSERTQRARDELLNECEEQWKQLEELQNKITLAGTDAFQDPESQVLNHVKALTAELKEWQERQPELLSKNHEVLLAVGKEELQSVNKELEMVLSCCQAKNEKLKQDLKSEQKWLEEQQELLTAATDRTAELQNEISRLSEAGVVQEMKKKIQKVKAYQESLLDTLGDFLAEHFPLPQQQGNANKKKKNFSPPSTVDLISLHEILELLMNKMFETPHEPYVTIDESFWPPYIEMLLRHGIALRHPENCYKIRLEAFHQ